MTFSCSDFYDFLKPECDRPSFIQDWLLKNGVQSSRIVIDGKNHILVQFDSFYYDNSCKVKTVVAHHDRKFPGLGANDNSAAVWILMNWAVELKQSKFPHNVRIFFTDGEEDGSNFGVKEQGAYALANAFRRLNIIRDDVFVFDACGRGSIPVLADTILPFGVNEAFRIYFDDLFRRTRIILNQASGAKSTRLPVPYSDNAAFLSCGIPCVAITMLPQEEARRYYERLVNVKGLDRLVMCGGGNYKKEVSLFLPDTWNMFHTEKDSLESLTPESIPVMQNILALIAESKTHF